MKSLHEQMRLNTLKEFYLSGETVYKFASAKGITCKTVYNWIHKYGAIARAAAAAEQRSTKKRDC